MPHCKMESDSSDAERLPDLASLDDFLASSFDTDIIVDDEDEVEGRENADSLGLRALSLEPFVEGAEHEDSDSESDSDTDSGSSGGDLDPQHPRLRSAGW